MELAEKYKANQNNFDRGSEYVKEKTPILDDIFYNETDWFQPKVSRVSSVRVITYLQNIRYNKYLILWGKVKEDWICSLTHSDL